MNAKKSDVWNFLFLWEALNSCALENLIITIRRRFKSVVRNQKQNQNKLRMHQICKIALKSEDNQSLTTAAWEKLNVRQNQIYVGPTNGKYKKN